MMQAYSWLSATKNKIYKSYTFEDIAYNLNRELPIPIQMVYRLATGCPPYHELGCILYKRVKGKTALNL